uniref:nitroreductase family protein n=1 Tax=Faecalibacterium prausnitzii TaxID=853 RepID=UPI00402565CF
MLPEAAVGAVLFLMLPGRAFGGKRVMRGETPEFPAALEGMRAQLTRMNAAVMGTDSDPMYGAPTILVVLADAHANCAVQDGSLVMGNLMLAAASLGLGSCWINRAREEFDSAEGKALLKKWGIEGDWIGVGHCILGYPAAAPKPAAPRKPDYIVRV